MVKQNFPDPNFEIFENRNFEIELKMSRKHQKWGFYITRMLSNNPAAQNVTNHRKNQFRSKNCKKFLDFVIFFKILWICLITLMAHNFFFVTEHLWKTPEMKFSDRVDIVLKKIHEKILIFRKVTDFFKKGFFLDPLFWE